MRPKTPNASQMRPQQTRRSKPVLGRNHALDAFHTSEARRLSGENKKYKGTKKGFNLRYMWLYDSGRTYSK